MSLAKEKQRDETERRERVDRTIYPEDADRTRDGVDRTIHKIQNNPARRLESLKKARKPEEGQKA
jgi:hypothetical protein